MTNASTNPNNYLGQEVVVQKVYDVGTSEVLISGKRNRTSIYLRNIGTDGSRISVQFSNVDAAVDGTGIILNQNEFIIDSNAEAYKCWSGDIKAICSTANGKLSVVIR